MSIHTTSLIGAPKLSTGGRLSPLETTTVLTTIGLSGLLAYILLVAVQAPEVAATIGAIGLGIAGLIFTIRRWSVALGTLFALVAGVLVVAPAPDDIARVLVQPADPLYIPLMFLFPLMALGTICGLAGTVQYGRRSKSGRVAPPWLRPVIAAALGVSLCGIVLGMVPRPAVTQAVSPSVLASLPALRTSGFAFDQTELHAHVGETVALRLDNSDNTTHTFTIDELGVDVSMLPGESSVALFRPTQPGTYTFYCKPHYDPTTGQGMHGTLIVE